MKKLNLLKTITDILWYLSLTSTIIFVIVIFYLTFSSDSNSVNIDGQSIPIDSITPATLFLMSFISYLLLLFGLYLFRKILKEFQAMRLFDTAAIKLLNRIGYVVIGAGLLNFLAKFLLELLVNEHFSFTAIPNQLLIFLGSGAFFLVLSEVFDKARKLKEENALTI